MVTKLFCSLKNELNFQAIWTLLRAKSPLSGDDGTSSSVIFITVFFPDNLHFLSIKSSQLAFPTLDKVVNFRFIFDLRLQISKYIASLLRLRNWNQSFPRRTGTYLTGLRCWNSNSNC